MKSKKGDDGVFRYVFPMNAKQSSAARHAQYCSMQSVLSRLYAAAKIESRTRNVEILVSLHAAVDTQ